MLRISSSSRARWSLLSAAVALVLGGTALPACQITVGDGLGGSPFGGESSGGRAAGGAATGGKGAGGAAAGGQGGAASGGSSSGGSVGGETATGGTGDRVDCQEDGEAEGTFKGVEMPDSCTTCLEDLCGEVWETCNAADPSAACRWGSTSFVVGDGTAVGEFDCMLACFDELGEDFIGDDYDVEQCAAQCGSAECDASQAGPVAVSLAECLIDTEDDLDGCQAECGL